MKKITYGAGIFYLQVLFKIEIGVIFISDRCFVSHRGAEESNTKSEINILFLKKQGKKGEKNPKIETGLSKRIKYKREVFYS